MIRRLIAIVLIVLGLGTLGAGIASGTVWKPDALVTVPLPAQPTENYVVSDPGVLTIVNPTVKVHVIAEDPETPVFLAMGRTADVDAWVAPSDHGRIAGLEEWESLTYRSVDAEPLPEPEEGEDEPELASTDPAESDMWVEEVRGIGEITYTWEEIPGRWSMLVASDGSGLAPMVELTWEREVPTPALIPGIVVGALLIVGGLILFIVDLLARRRRLEEPAEPVEGDAVISAGEDPVEDAAPSPEEIMAGLEADSQEADPLVATGGFSFDEEAQPEADESYPHRLEESAPAEPEPEPPAADAAPRLLTRREIREQERLRERAKAMEEGDGPDSEKWPTQSAPGAPEEPTPAPARRWWKRRGQPPEAAPTGPIMIDDDTGEIIITGEIDVSNLGPGATADSWRATWGLDKDTKTRWVPVMRTAEEHEEKGDDDA